MANIKIDFDGEELDITYELVKGEDESDIARSSDQIVIQCILWDGLDETAHYSSHDITRIEEIIFEQTK